MFKKQIVEYKVIDITSYPSGKTGYKVQLVIHHKFCGIKYCESREYIQTYQGSIGNQPYYGDRIFTSMSFARKFANKMNDGLKK